MLIGEGSLCELVRFQLPDPVPERPLEGIHQLRLRNGRCLRVPVLHAEHHHAAPVWAGHTGLSPLRPADQPHAGGPVSVLQLHPGPDPRSAAAATLQESRPVQQQAHRHAPHILRRILRGPSEDE